MKKSMKIVLLIVCVLALMAGSVLGTLAYLTASDSVKNTFTVGKVNITLEEYKINAETGKKATPEALVKGNEDIKMIPGRTIEKEPVLKVLANSETCYVRLFVKITWPDAANGKFDSQEYKDWFNFNTTQWDAKGVIKDGSESGDKTGVDIFEFWYAAPVNKADADTTLSALFTEIKIPAELDAAQMNSINNSAIELIAQAVQAEGFTDGADYAANAAAAWAAVGYPEGITTTQTNP